MNVFVRFWNGTNRCVKVRYYGSPFLGHASYTDILNHFVGMAKDLKSECLYQVSLDGPTVNMKVCKEFSEKKNHLMVLVVALSTFSNWC